MRLRPSNDGATPGELYFEIRVILQAGKALLETHLPNLKMVQSPGETLAIASAKQKGLETCREDKTGAD
jgi:hypothetical protein